MTEDRNPGRPPCYVLDTNAIIDLQSGNLLEKIFSLPCTFIITDFIVHELREPPFHVLSSLGLTVESLVPDEVREISCMMERYEKPSYEDISVLVLARSRKTVLITGDNPLRHAAIENGVVCLGTCCLIDFLAEQRIIHYGDAVAAHNLIRRNGQHPPWDECASLLAKWKQREKILD